MDAAEAELGLFVRCLFLCGSAASHEEYFAAQLTFPRVEAQFGEDLLLQESAAKDADNSHIVAIRTTMSGMIHGQFSAFSQQEKPLWHTTKSLIRRVSRQCKQLFK
jgi:hypothetical protein